jgi:hypothetical protein
VNQVAARFDHQRPIFNQVCRVELDGLDSGVDYVFLEEIAKAEDPRTIGVFGARTIPSAS